MPVQLLAKCYELWISLDFRPGFRNFVPASISKQSKILTLKTTHEDPWSLFVCQAKRKSMFFLHPLSSSTEDDNRYNCRWSAGDEYRYSSKTAMKSLLDTPIETGYDSAPDTITTSTSQIKFAHTRFSRFEAAKIQTVFLSSSPIVQVAHGFVCITTLSWNLLNAIATTKSIYRLFWDTKVTIQNWYARYLQMIGLMTQNERKYSAFSAKNKYIAFLDTQNQFSPEASPVVWNLVFSLIRPRPPSSDDFQFQVALANAHDTAVGFPESSAVPGKVCSCPFEVLCRCTQQTFLRAALWSWGLIAPVRIQSRNTELCHVLVNVCQLLPLVCRLHLCWQVAGLRSQQQRLTIHTNSFVRENLCKFAITRLRLQTWVWERRSC